MTRDLKHFAGVMAACLALMLLVAVASIAMRPPAPLTTIEKRLVGNWDQVNLPGEDRLSDMKFTADRAFRGNDGQFVGRWSISTGQLHIKYWRGDWREDWSNWQPHRLWRALRWRDEVTLSIRFVGDGERVELAEPGKPPCCALVRPQ